MSNFRVDVRFLQMALATDEGVTDLLPAPVVADVAPLPADPPIGGPPMVGTEWTTRACIVQPFMDNVLAEGEYSMFFFNGAFSHAILKIPAAGEFRSQEERGAEIRSVAPERKLLSAGEGALAAVSPTPLYARVDLVRDLAGDFALMELELIEPSLYLRMAPAAPRRFAAALDTWFAGNS